MYWVNTNLNHRPATSDATASQSRLRLRSLEPTLEDFAHLMRLRLLARRTQVNAKADAAEAEIRGVPAAVRRPTTLGADPTAPW